MRSLSLINKNHQTLQQIKSTTIDQLIDFFQKQHKNISNKNDQKIDQLTMKLNHSKQLFDKKLTSFQVDLLEASPLFSYYKFDKFMIRAWMDQIEKKMDLNAKFVIRLIVNQSNVKYFLYLYQCKTCNFIVHAQCYPKLGKNYEKNQFKCQNCQKIQIKKPAVYSVHEKVVISYKSNAYYNENPSIVIYLIISLNQQIEITKHESGLKLKLKKLPANNQRKLFVHLSCSLWHSQLQYSHQQQKLINIHRIDRSKTQNTCFQCGTNIGITIPCVDQNCRRFYHVQCARRIPLIINAKNQLSMQLYCQRHTRCHTFQILKQNILKNLKTIKTFMKSINQVSRMRASNNYIESNYKKYQQNPINQRYDFCIYCRISIDDDKIDEKIVNCWKCYNWYHEKCGAKCNVCVNIQEKGGV